MIDEINIILSEIIANANEWGIVIAFVLYVGFRIYQTWEQGRPLRTIEKQVVPFLDEVRILLKELGRDFTRLSSRIDRLMDYILRR